MHTNFNVSPIRSNKERTVSEKLERKRLKIKQDRIRKQKRMFKLGETNGNCS